MKFGLYDVLTLIGSLGFFIYGMKIMSEGIQKVAGARMRQILRVMTSNRVYGVVTGFLLTSLVQSSSATTVMVVSFVNAGLLSLVESIGVIMGANIGTTITAWIISILGLKVKLADMALPIIAFGFPLLFSSRNRLKSWGEVIIGFALLFMGLQALKDAVPDIKSNPEMLEFLTNYTDLGLFSTLIFIGIGTLLTVVVQSSSATMAITILMANEGWIPFEIAAAMILGENIGTTITANLAALVANSYAKRAARAHFIFNIFGVIWMLILFRWFLTGIDAYMVKNDYSSPFQDALAIPFGLSIFHTAFNIINVVLLIGFVNFIAKVVTKMIPIKGDEKEFGLEYISRGLVATPEVSLEEVAKEISKFGKITARMSGFVGELINNKKSKNKTKVLKKIKKYEEITDKVQYEIATYLSKLPSAKLSMESSLRLRGMLAIINDLERIGDLFYQMSLSIEQKNESESWFTPNQVKDLLNMLAKLDEAFEIMNANLLPGSNEISLKLAIDKEKEINKFRDKLRKKHLKHLEKGEYDVLSSLAYADLFSLMERTGDHIINVSEGITGELAKDEEDI
ncbi:MAG: Na/Pi cotransporter family protein [Bacteroidota bacterium]